MGGVRSDAIGAVDGHYLSIFVGAYTVRLFEGRFYEIRRDGLHFFEGRYLVLMSGVGAGAVAMVLLGRAEVEKEEGGVTEYRTNGGGG